MSESIDLPAGEMRGGCHQILMFRTKGELIGEGCGVDVRTKTGMLCHILYAFPIIVDHMVKVFKALDVIFFRHDAFHFLSFPFRPWPLRGELILLSQRPP
jgi:hypothetical protein